MAQTPPPPLTSWEGLISTVGVPGVALLLLLWQVIPRIDHAIELGERIDSRITVLATYCAPVQPPRAVSP